MMSESIKKIGWIAFWIAFSLTACTTAPKPEETAVPTAAASPTAAAAPTLTPTQPPARVLTICMAQEPSSLFLYGDGSTAARSIREAIYDGPLDLLNFDVSPVILTKKPAGGDGDVGFQAVSVNPGGNLVDASGNLTTLKEGVVFAPSGCNEAACQQTYSGQEPVTLDQMIVRFQLRSGLTWSDGSPLTADDSVYSFEVAQALSPRYRPDLLARTEAYVALGEDTLEWRGLPGYKDPQYATNFFQPLPRHAWGAIAPRDLLTLETATRSPLGWGPYVLQEWTAGDHISLKRNPAYFRASEGLPKFDELVFRFVANGDEALNALLAGECDYVDETARLETYGPRLTEIQTAGQAVISATVGTAWEHLDFGIQPYAAPLADGSPAPVPPSVFAQKEVRQAVAQCINRQKLADGLFFMPSVVPDSYLAPDSPYHSSQTRRYEYNPQAANDLLTAAGWVDLDGNPSSPRNSQGVLGMIDGTPLQFSLMIPEDSEKQQVAEAIRSDLSQCGFQVDLQALPWEQFAAPGPDGPVFGRRFGAAQFGWMASWTPACSLFTTAEIPGPYPQFGRGWGGANLSGYSNPAYDAACQLALNSLPDLAIHQAAHQEAERLFAEDLPALPLYLRLKVVAARPDLCNLRIDPSSDSSLWNLEALDYGEGCQGSG